MSAGNEWANEAESSRCPRPLLIAAGWLIAAAAVVLGSIGWAGQLGGRAGGGRRG